MAESPGLASVQHGARPGQPRLAANPRSPAQECRRRFLRFFPAGFTDETYLDWERGYKAEAHARWQDELSPSQLRGLLREKRFDEIVSRAIRIESRTNLLFSFEKMAFRDAVKDPAGAELFAEGLYTLLYGRGSEATRFESWCETVGKLPRTKTRVLTHPVVTVFPFIAAPERHIFLKPNVTRRAAQAYGFDFVYSSKPSWKVYSSLLSFVDQITADLKQMRPKDVIDIQSFIWVLGSDEYT